MGYLRGGSMRRRVLVAIAVVSTMVVAGCNSDTSNGSETADQLADVEAAMDQFIAAFNTGDADAVVAALADEFYFKGLSPYEPERTDAESMKSYVTALAPLDVRIERVADVTEDEAGFLMVEVIISSDELEPRLTQMEQLEVEGAKLSRLVTVSWEKTG